jgi:hypothetical protein
MATAANGDDGRAYAWPGARQEPEPRSGFLPRHDRGGQVRVLGRLLPDASIPLLAHEIPARLDQYRAFGNAIDPEVAAEFIRACC